MLPVAPAATTTAASIVGALPVSPVAPRASTPAKEATAPPQATPATTPQLGAWAALAAQTAASERYRAAAARLDALAAAAPAAWVRSRPYGAWCAHLPQALAIDCEMCVTEDPATGALDGKALVRISIVDASRLDACAAAAAAGAHDDVVLDSLVKPSLPIKDAVERVHGIKASDLDGVAFTLAHAQAALAQLCPDGFDVVFEGVGGAMLQTALDHLADDGRLLQVGAISEYPHNPAAADEGARNELDALSLFWEGKTVKRGAQTLYGNAWPRENALAAMRACKERVLARHAAGELVALVDDAEAFIGLERTSDAIAHMLSGKTTGKVVVKIGEEVAQE